MHMNISYKTMNMELTHEIQAYAEEKLEAVERSLTRLPQDSQACEVIFTKDTHHATGSVYRADFTIFAGGERVHAVGHGESITAAMDEAKDELTRRVRENKRVHVRMLRTGGAAIKRLLRME